MSNTYAKIRTDYNNNYPYLKDSFPIEVSFKKLLQVHGMETILVPIQIPLITDFQFQKFLSFKIDIYEQLPLRPDIAFDLAWRTFEAYCLFFSKEKSWASTKTHKILTKASEDILYNHYRENTSLKESIEVLLKSIPLQLTEFLVSRLFEETTSSLKSQQTQIKERVTDIMGLELISALGIKYAPLTASNQRKAGILFQKLISGERVTINNKRYDLNLLERIKLLINGVLYSYRNERFHGDAFSPFRSSKTTLKTFAFCNYCLIAVYFFLSQLMYEHFQNEFELNDISLTLRNTIDNYNSVFAKHKS